MTAVVPERPVRWRVAAEQTVALAVRAVRNTARDPGAWLPPMIFPLVLAAIYGAQFSRATELPGFPEVDSFLQFVLPASILQGVSFNAGDAGTAMATDIENGFFDRLISSPTSRLAIFLGRLAGAIVFSAILATLLVVVFTVFGAPVQGGFVATVALVVISAFLAVSIGGFSLAVAIRTGSAEATQAMFPLTFVIIFVSSAFFPTGLMTGWYQQVAEVNPFTLIVDPTRRIALGGFTWSDFGQAMFWIGVVAFVSLGLSYRAYVRRLRST
ncbi:MAG: ABC transporter permease [Actinomycetota bacterium]